MNFLSFIPSLMQMGSGIAQLFGGIGNQPTRPSYQIPEAEKQALAASKRLAAQDKLPGQEILENQMGEKTASMSKLAGKMGGSAVGIGALAKLYGQEQQARRNLAVDAARYKAQNQGQMIGQLSNMARYQDKAYQENVKNKYGEEAGASSALIQAGMSNAFSGLSNIAGAGSYGSLFKNMGTNPNMPNYQKGGGAFPDTMAAVGPKAFPNTNNNVANTTLNPNLNPYLQTQPYYGTSYQNNPFFSMQGFTNFQSPYSNFKTGF